jgi:hypothetical protein
MGFGTARIHISEHVAHLAQVNPTIIAYWNTVYDNVLAEYMYINKSTFCHIEITYSAWEGALFEERVVGSSWPVRRHHDIIVPLGGGKDSLVVWHSLRDSHPLLVYVADGFEEYECNHRLERIVQETQCDKLLGQKVTLAPCSYSNRICFCSEARLPRC